MEEKNRVYIDALYKQLTTILRYKNYSPSTIQLYQERVKRIKKYMLLNDIDYYSPTVADDFYREEVEPRGYISTTKRGFRTVIRRLNDIYEGSGFVYSVPRKTLTIPKSFQPVVSDYLNYCRKIGNRPITVKCKERMLHFFFTYLNENRCRKIDDINGSNIVQFSINTSNKELYPELRDFLRYLLAQGYIQKDFSTLVPKFYRGRCIPTIYKPSEIAAIEKAVDRTSSPGKRDYAIILLASRLGMRAGDIASLKFNSLDFEKERIRFIQNKTGNPSDLYMIPEIQAALKDYIISERPASSSEFVFLKSFAPYTEISYSVVSFTVKKYILRSGIDISRKKHGPHSLRSSLVTSMINDGISYESVRRVLGHNSPNAIKHYAKLDLSILRNCALECSAPSGNLFRFLEGGGI